MNTFVVANGLNTSYIDSLLIALFYKQSHLRSILSQFPEQSKFLYLQELINNNFIDNVKHSYSVDSSIVNEIRNYSIVCGWKDNGNITDLYSVSDYMKFLMDGIGFGKINIEFVESNGFENEKVRSLTVNYVDTLITDNTDVKVLLSQWYDNNTKVKGSNSKIICHRFTEVPLLIPIWFNRTQGTSYKVDIKKRIKFTKNTDSTQSKMSWVIHSLICFSSSGGGGYYSIVNTEHNQWYMFSNDNLPSLISINITDQNMSSKLKQECVMAIYKLDWGN